MKTNMHFCAYLKCNLLNVYLSKKCFEQICREEWTTYLTFTTHLWYTYSFKCNWMNWTLCIHFWISILSNHNGLLIRPKTWIIHIFQLFVHLSPFFSTNIWQYTAFVNNSILFKHSMWTDLAEKWLAACGSQIISDC
jgi:hypothetical protein